MSLTPSAATVNKLLIPMLRQIVSKPRLASALFGRDRWGDPFGDDRYENPYPMLEKMRADGPVVYRAAYQMWFVTGHDQVLAVLNHPNASVYQQIADLMGVRPYSKLAPKTRAFYLNWMLVQDPPNHSRLRSLVNRAFTVRRMAELEPQVERLAFDLIDRIRGQESVEIVEAFNNPLPVNVIASMLGIPEERWGWAQQLLPVLTKFLNPFELWGHEEVDEAVEEFHSYIVELVDQRRSDPRDDLLTALVQAEDDGDRLTLDELVANAGLLFFAGMDTTASQLGNSLLALEDFPEQRELLRGKPELWPNAVEELLRYDSALAMGQRFSTGDIEVGGQVIPARANIGVMIPAGNRDPQQWENADQLILDRPDPRPVSFGFGAHHCLGHALARMEVRVGLRALLDEFGAYTIDRESLVWRRNLAVRGPLRLVLTRG